MRPAPFLAVIALLSGCATYPPAALAPQIESALHGASIAPTHRPDSDLFVHSTTNTTAGVLGGAVGGDLAAILGNKAVNDELRAAGLTYPNEALQHRLLDRLRSKYRAVILSSVGVVLNERSGAFDPSASTTPARYILDTDAAWSCSHLPLHWGRYQFHLIYSVQLLDRATGKVLLADRFEWRTPGYIGYPSRKEFTTDPDKGVEAQLAAATAAAESHFAARLRL